MTDNPQANPGKLILAIDTTAEFGSVALARAQGTQVEVIEAVPMHSREGFGHLVFQQINALLARSGATLGEIDCYAAASGPGSFTGVRVGMTAAKGLAEAHGKPVAPVSNLMAVACAGSGSLRAGVLDARRGEIYGAVYDQDLRLVLDEVVTTLPRFLEMLEDRAVTFAATDFAPFRAGVSGTRFENAPVVTVDRALAGPISQIAGRMLAEGRAMLPEQADATYVRRSDAEKMWREA